MTDRYTWEYHQADKRRWVGSVRCGNVRFYDGQFTAFSERRLRNKIARFVRKARRIDARFQQTHRTSGT